MSRQSPRRTWTVTRPLALGIGALLFALGTFGVWASLAQLSGAVIGAGMIEVSTTRTAVSHPIGGVVTEILKGNGDRVQAGEVILRLDGRALWSDLAVSEGALFETLANIARLEAALAGNRGMAPHPLLAAAMSDRPDTAAVMARMQRQLDDHFAAIDTEMRLLDEQIVQIRAQIDGVQAQADAKRDELAIVTDELVRARDLTGQGLIRTSERSLLEKNEIGLRGEMGQLAAQMAELRGKIAESELKRLAVMTDSSDLMAAELSKLRPERTRFEEQRSRLIADLERLDIRAPVAGQIIDSVVMGEQSVVLAASPLMMIVPSNEPVLARVRVAATDIDQIFVGQDASLKFKAFNGRQIPIVLGRVRQISADAFVDPGTKRSYYEVGIGLLETEMAKAGDTALIPGMPVEAFMATEARTPISYLMRPILFYFDRAFRDA